MIYFIETNKPSATPSDLESFGLSHILDVGDSLASVQAVSNTPGGQRGLLVCNRKRFGTDGLVLEHDWSAPFPGLSTPVRVAWKEKPTPETLARGKQLRGYWLTDACESRWQLPVVRRVSDDGTPVTALPCYRRLDADGNLVKGDPKDEFRYLWDASEEPWNRLLASYEYEQAVRHSLAANESIADLGQPPELTDAEVLGWLSPIVSANYVIGATELVMLNAFDDGGRDPTGWLSLAIGLADFIRRSEDRQRQKKTASDTSLSGPSPSTSSAGETAST